MGSVRGFRRATRMAKISWNYELALFAEINAKQCKLVRRLDSGCGDFL
jgi:Cysteine-rich secretory protein family